MKETKPEGKLTLITDYGDGKAIVVDGVSMETVRKLEDKIKELESK